MALLARLKQGLVARAKTKGKRFDRSQEDLECYYFHNKGHIKANCQRIGKKKFNPWI